MEPSQTLTPFMGPPRLPSGPLSSLVTSFPTPVEIWITLCAAPLISAPGPSTGVIVIPLSFILTFKLLPHGPVTLSDIHFSFFIPSPAFFVSHAHPVISAHKS